MSKRMILALAVALAGSSALWIAVRASHGRQRPPIERAAPVDPQVETGIEAETVELQTPEEPAPVPTIALETAETRAAENEGRVPVATRPKLGLDGIVVDETGAPVTSFRVQAYRATFFGKRDEMNATFESAAGSFHIELPKAGKWRLSVEADGYAQLQERLSVRIPLGGGPCKVVMVRLATVTGLVLDPLGNPVADAVVVDGRSSDCWTDAQGRFTFGSRTGEPIALEARHHDWVASEPILAISARELAPEVVLRLRAGGCIRGEAIDSGGRPLAGRTIKCERDGEEEDTTTDASGRFVFERVIPGKLLVSLAPEGEEPSDLVDTINWMGKTTVQVIEIDEGEVVSVVLQENQRSPVRMHGVVTAAGRPLEGAFVFAAAEGGPVQQGMKAASVDEHGRYELVLDQPGDYAFIVGKEQAGQDPYCWFYLDVPSVADLEHDFALPGGQITGRVVGPGGAPLGKARVHLTREEGQLGFEDLPAQQKTNEEGLFHFQNLAPGIYALAVQEGNASRPVDLGTVVVGGIVLREGHAVGGIEIELAEGGELLVLVSDDQGAPVNGASVFVRDERGRLLSMISPGKTDSSGRFHYAQLPSGRLTASARTDRLTCVDSVPVEIRPGLTSEIELVLRPGTILVASLLDGDAALRARFQVLDERGRPVHGMVSLDAGDTALTEGFSSKATRAGPLPPGEYTLVATALDGRQARESVRLVPGELERRVTLRLR